MIALCTVAFEMDYGGEEYWADETVSIIDGAQATGPMR